MTPRGAQMVIDAMSLRVFEIEGTQGKLAEEKAHLQKRIKELEAERDAPPPIVPTRINMVV